MHTSSAKLPYNERLFRPLIRGRFQAARFHAFDAALRSLPRPPRRVIELGCYDGKIIRRMPVAPAHYLGIDANWEGGLDIARREWQGHPEYRFLLCEDPSGVPVSGESFDLAIAMEVLEHLSDERVEGYLATLARVTDGYLFVAVPTEKGPVFAIKYLIKRFIHRRAQDYTVGEYMNATLGNLRAVERNDHKGFDYTNIIAAVDRHFDVIDIAPYPVRWLPRWLGFGVGILARSRRPVRPVRRVTTIAR